MSKFRQVFESRGRCKMKRNIRLNKTYMIRILVILVLISALMIMKKIHGSFLVHSNGTKVLDMRFGYAATDVFKLFTSLGVDGRLIYSRYLCDDFVFIISFAIVQNYILKFAMGKAMLNSRWRFLLAIAYFRAFFDTTENIIIFILLNSFPTMSLSLVTVVSNVTKLKFIILGIWLFAIAVSLAARIKISQKSKVEVV